MSKRKKLVVGYDIRSPLERVLEILNGLRDQVGMDQTKLLEDLTFCIKIISSNQLYEARLDIEMNPGGENEKGRNEVQMLLNTYSKQGG